MSSNQIMIQKYDKIMAESTTLPCGRTLVPGFTHIVKRHFKVCKLCRETVEWTDDHYQHSFSEANLSKRQEKGMIKRGIITEDINKLKEQLL